MLLHCRKGGSQAAVPNNPYDSIHKQVLQIFFFQALLHQALPWGNIAANIIQRLELISKYSNCTGIIVSLNENIDAFFPPTIM